MIFDEAAYKKRRDIGLRGQGDVPELPTPKLIKKDETGAYIVNTDNLSNSAPNRMISIRSNVHFVGLSLSNMNKDYPRKDQMTNHRRVLYQRELRNKKGIK